MHRPEIGLQAIQLSPYSAGPAAPRTQRLARSLLSWHAIVPFTFRIQVKPSDPRTSLRVLPGCAGDTTGRLTAQRMMPLCARFVRPSGVASGVAVDDLTQSRGESLWLTCVARLATEEAPVVARELGQRQTQCLGRRCCGAPGKGVS